MSASLSGRVVRVIEERGARCALVGAYALAARGLVRGTHDVDLMTADASVLEIDWAGELGGDIDVSVFRGDADDPLRGAVRMIAATEAVDLVVAKWKWQAALIERSEILDLGTLVVRVPGPADLLLLKVDAGSYLDQRDAAHLIEIHGPALIDAARAHLVEVPEALRLKFEGFVSALGR